MKLLNLKEAYIKAKNGGYGIGAFNVYNLETAQAVAEAARKLNSPVIFQITPNAIRYAGLNQIFEIVENEILEKEIDAAIHLDHALDFGIVKECIDLGFNSVMIDGSSLPYLSNIALTEKVVNYAKRHDVCVEAELGRIARGEGGKITGNSEFTDPAAVPDFIERTGLDSLAVAVGNEHGAPKGEKIDFELLSEIVKMSRKPIVIHGASGLSRHDIRDAIECGVVKYNIDTKIRQTFKSGLIDNIKEDDPRKILTEVKADIVKLVADYIKIFGSEGK